MPCNRVIITNALPHPIRDTDSPRCDIGPTGAGTLRATIPLKGRARVAQSGVAYESCHSVGIILLWLDFRFRTADPVRSCGKAKYERRKLRTPNPSQTGSNSQKNKNTLQRSGGRSVAHINRQVFSIASPAVDFSIPAEPTSGHPSKEPALNRLPVF